MGVEGQLAELIGKKAMGLQAASTSLQVMQRFGALGTKAGVLASRDNPMDTQGHEILDISSAMPLRGDGFQTKALLPRQYTKSPELFVTIGGVWTPLMQTGTFLKGQGFDIPDELAFVMDFAVDWVNLISLGTVGLAGKVTGNILSGMTKAGHMGRVLAIASMGGKIKNGAKVMKRIEMLLMKGMKVGNRGEDLLKSAKAGDIKALRHLISDSLAHGKLTKLQERTLNAFRKDAKHLGRVLENSEDFARAMDLSPAMLQNTFLARIHAGQVNAPFRITKLSNPIKHPLKFTRQMLGFTYAGDEFWYPMSVLSARGLDKVGKGVLIHTKGTTRLVPHAAKAGEDLAKQAVILQKDLSQSYFKPGFFKGHNLNALEAMVPLEALKAILMAPSDRMYRHLGLGDLPDGMVEGGYRKLHQMKPKAKIDPEKLQEFADLVIKGANSERKALDAHIRGQRKAILQRAQTRLREVGSHLDLGEEIIKGHEDQFRRMYEAFEIKSLRYDAFSPGHGLAARSSLGTLLARMSNDNFREVVFASYKGRLARELIDETIPMVIRHMDRFVGADNKLVKGLFEKIDGKYFLRKGVGLKEMKAAKADLLISLLEKSKKAKKGIFLEDHLRNQGLHHEVSAIIDSMDDALIGIGENFAHHEGILVSLQKGYFQQVFRPNNKFFTEFKLTRQSSSEFMEKLADEADDIKRIRSLLGDDSPAILLKKIREGKITFAMIKRNTEAMAVRLEEMGYGTYRKGGIAIFSGYLDGANKALLVNRLIRDMPEMSGALTLQGMQSFFGSKLPDTITQEWLVEHGIRRIMRVEDMQALGKNENVWNQIKNFGKTVKTRQRALKGIEDLETLTRKGIAKAANTGLFKEARRIAVTKVVAKLKNRKRLINPDTGHQFIVQVREKGRGGDLVSIEVQPAWVESVASKGRVPQRYLGGTIQNRPGLRKAIQSLLDEEIEAVNVAARQLGEEATTGAARAALPGGGKIQGDELWVFAPDAAHLQDTLNIFQRQGANSKFWRAYDNLNFQIKSVILMGDIFHLNVLGITQFLTNPVSVLKHLVTDAGDLLPGVREGGFRSLPSNTAFASAVGGAVGGGVGQLTGADDNAELAGFSIAGALYGATIAGAMKNARWARKTALNPDNLDTLRWMGLGGFTGRPDDRSIGIIQRGLKNVRNSLAKGDGPFTALISPIDNIRFIADAWDRQLWETMHLGSKHAYFTTMWGKHLPRLEKSAAWKKAAETARAESQRLAKQGVAQEVTVDQVRHQLKINLARNINQLANNAFGGQAFRNLLADPDLQYVMRRFLLAPDWTSSRLAMAANVFMNQGKVKSAIMGGSIGTAVEMVEAGFDPSEIKGRGAVLGAAGGLLMGRWARAIAKNMITTVGADASRESAEFLAKESRRLWGAALLGGYVFATALNRAFTGTWMHENEEGRRLAIRLPGGDFVQLGKPWLEAFEFASIAHPEKFPIPIISRFASKAAVIPMAGLRLGMNKEGVFGPIMTGTENPIEMAGIIGDYFIDSTTPIFLQGPLRQATQAFKGTADDRGAGRALIRFAGFQTLRGSPILNNRITDAAIQANAPQSIGATRSAFRVP